MKLGINITTKVMILYINNGYISVKTLRIYLSFSIQHVSLYEKVFLANFLLDLFFKFFLTFSFTKCLTLAAPPDSHVHLISLSE